MKLNHKSHEGHGEEKVHPFLCALCALCALCVLRGLFLLLIQFDYQIMGF